MRRFQCSLDHRRLLQLEVERVDRDDHAAGAVDRAAVRARPFEERAGHAELSAPRVALAMPVRQ